MAAVAGPLVVVERLRYRPRVAPRFPRPEAALERGHAAVSELLQRAGGEGGACTRRAIEHDLGGLVGHLSGDVPFEDAPRDVTGAGNGPLLVFVRLSHIDHHGAGTEALLELDGGDFLDFGADLADQVLIAHRHGDNLQPARA